MWCLFGSVRESLHVDAAGFCVTCPLQDPDVHQL